MQKKTEVKGIRIGFKTGAHDMEVKAKRARKFMEDGNTVKFHGSSEEEKLYIRTLREQKCLNFKRA
ncbi:hypothetical protein JKY72_06050 [Candidatus Gracilibacteria bacterium]|nr:hypothetical protein [Candidatus Gracilibacteria bacterium]